MKKPDTKSLLTGIVTGCILTGTMLGVYAASGVKTASVSPAKVTFYGEQIPLEKPLVSVVREGTEGREYAELYMPMDEILGYLNVQTEYDAETQTVRLTMKNAGMYGAAPAGEAYDWLSNGYTAGHYPYNGHNSGYDASPQKDADQKAADIIQRTGNWSYIEPYLPYMSEQGIETAVSIYNGKHGGNPSEQKKASDYIKK